MSPIRKLLRLASVVGVLAVLILGMSSSTLAQKDEGKGKGKKGKDQPNLVEVDLNKLSPDLAKQIREALKATEPKGKGKKMDDGKKKEDGKKEGKKKKGKDISLSDAIRIAETVCKGECVKAERKTKDGQSQFKLEVVVATGAKEKLTLDPRGNVLKLEQKDAKKKDKGKKKDSPDEGP